MCMNPIYRTQYNFCSHGTTFDYTVTINNVNQGQTVNLYQGIIYNEWELTGYTAEKKPHKHSQLPTLASSHHLADHHHVGT